MKKNRVWLCRDKDTNYGCVSYRIHLSEPQWEAFWRSSNSIGICCSAAESFLGKVELLQGECVEVNCTFGTVWEK